MVKKKKITHLELSTKRTEAHFVAVLLSPVLCDPLDYSHQAPLSMGFPRQEYWSGLPFPSPGDLPDPGIEPWSPAFAVGFFTTEPPGKPRQAHIPRALSVHQGLPCTQVTKDSVCALTLCRFFRAAAAGRLPQQAAPRGKEAG